MKFENAAVFNFEGAIRGMRNPLNSWDKSDSHYCLLHECVNCKYGNCQESKKDAFYWDPCASDIDWTSYLIGENDMDLAQRLIKGGSEHSKFMRQIFVSVDITAPMYWWSEADTYKVSTVANSTSKMHKLASTPITLDCFEIDDLNDGNMSIGNYNCLQFMYNQIIDDCELLRQKYLETKDIRYWKELIRWLPESWLQTRTWTANYAVLRNIYFQRKNHKLSEWHQFCNWIESLPYAKELITYGKT